DPVEPFTTEFNVETVESDETKTVFMHFPPELEGINIRILAGEKLYDIPYLMHETVKMELDPSVGIMTVGIKAEDSQYFFKEFEI
ncbi:hypothetical protein IKP13_06635, partial [bacterium]|nr:hypothetical protein [bacterium]